MSKRWLLRIINLWPPYLFAGIRAEFSPDLRSVDVRLKLGLTNRNYFGTHFGGSLYSMTDPFYTLILTEQLGRGYQVWDKAATVSFRKPGTGTVRAHFEISEERVAEIRAAADREGKTEPAFTVHIVDASGDVVAEVEKVLFVRRARETPAGEVDLPRRSDSHDRSRSR